MGMRSALLALLLLLGAGCAGAASPDSGEVSPTSRALPPDSASGHATDGPTSTRTSAQRPVEQGHVDDEEEGGDEPPGILD